MNCFDIIVIELQLNCNKLHHIYDELQMVIATQKLNCNANCKHHFFHSNGLDMEISKYDHFLIHFLGSRQENQQAMNIHILNNLQTWFN
jgi:hypothetical protein